MNDYNSEKVLKSYIATSGYTIRALEDAIAELKGAINITDDLRLLSTYQDIIEELDKHLSVITYAD